MTIGVTQLKLEQTFAAGAAADPPELGAKLTVEEEVGVGIGVGVGVSVWVGIGAAVAQMALVMLFPFNVTLLVCDRARPFKVAPFPKVMAPSVRTFPII